MEPIEELKLSALEVLNFPLLVLGKSQITLSVLLVTLFLALAFLFISTKVRNLSIMALSRRPGLNISNWRAVINLTYYAVIGLGMMAILQSTGLDLSILTVLTGAIGIGIGFGLQPIFANLISGVIILLEKPLKLGDRIEVGLVSGNVKSISVRATTILTNDNVAIIVPNSDFISKQVINWTHSGHHIRTSISVNVAYGSDADLVKKILLQVAAGEPGVLESPPPTVRLEEFGDNGLKFKLLVWTSEYCDRVGALKSLLNFSVLKMFNEQNIKIPYQQRDIYVHQVQTPIEE